MAELQPLQIICSIKSILQTLTFVAIVTPLLFSCPKWKLRTEHFLSPVLIFSMCEHCNAFFLELTNTVLTVFSFAITV